ncbi:MAG: hypothetical protein CM1200mP9_07220 [Gammaproteobacteria bacterium]|nr:MAG: hypothetical protein CM1200mP9_07220 [Gammaproteobacteria bacterium]
MYARVRSAKGGSSGSPRRLRIRYPRLKGRKTEQTKDHHLVHATHVKHESNQTDPKRERTQTRLKRSRATDLAITSTIPITHQSESPKCRAASSTPSARTRIRDNSYSLSSVARVPNLFLWRASHHQSCQAGHNVRCHESITFSSRASDAVRLVLLEPVFSAHSNYVPEARRNPHLRDSVVHTLRSMLGSIASPSPGPECRPMVVAGAIAAT